MLHPHLKKSFDYFSNCNQIICCSDVILVCCHVCNGRNIFALECAIYDVFPLFLQICDDADIDLSVAVGERKPRAEFNVDTQEVKR